jgi:hypothetical protein
VYERKEGESYFDYANRIIDNKSIYDLDNTEAYKLLFDEELASDECRKRLYGVKRILEELKKEQVKNITSNDILKELELKKIDIKKERVKIASLRSELNKSIRTVARDELVLEEIRDCIKQVKEVEFTPLQAQNGEKSYLLNLADIHYGAKFKSINNEYSIEICRFRFQKLLGELIKIIQEKKISKLYIVSLGDVLSGLIRISDLKRLEIGLIQSVVDFSRFMAEWLNELSKYVEIEYIHVISSNHCELRLFEQQRSQDNEDLELLVANYIQDLLKNNQRIKVRFSEKDYYELSLQGYNILLMHGHQVSKKTTDIVKDLVFRNKKWYSTVYFGHDHHYSVDTVSEDYDSDIEIITLPSIVGSDPFSDKVLRGSKSAAVLSTFEKGKCRVNDLKILLN